MKYIVSKEFILEAHEAWSSEWKSKIEKEVPELFKNRLEAGKWYWSIANKLICLTSVDVLRAYYYGFSSSNDWIGKEWMDNASVDIEATKEEVETALIAEARKRGFKEGVNYDSTNVGFPSQIKCYINSNEFLYKTNNVLLIDNWRIFADGNWATIVLEDEVKELTVAELEEKLGYKIKIVKAKKAQIKFTLFESKRLEDDLWEVFTTYHWDNGTHTTKDVSHHSSKRLAEEQGTINKFKTLGI